MQWLRSLATRRNRSFRPRHAKRSTVHRKLSRFLEVLERREVLSGDTLPVLMVIADQQDFYYQEYGDTRAALEAAGLSVAVAATTTHTAYPHPNSGQGAGNGAVMPDLALADVNPDDYSAIVFVGGWGSSMYQYAYNDPDLNGTVDNFYSNSLYNGDANLDDGVMAPQKIIVNDLINAFLAEDKHVGAICHGVTVLAWARVDGVSPLSGRQVAVPHTVSSPEQFYDGQWRVGGYFSGQYDQLVANGALASPVSGIIGDPSTVADDVVVDGKIITAENYDSSLLFGQTVAQQVLAAAPAANQTPAIFNAMFGLEENSPAATPVGQVIASDPDAGQSLVFSIVGGNLNGAFAIDPLTGMLTVANPAALNFETQPEFQLIVEVADNGAPVLTAQAEILVQLTDVPESSVLVAAGDLVIRGTDQADTIFVWSARNADSVYAWLNGQQHGPFHLPGGHVRVFSGSGNDRVFATDLRIPAMIYGEDGHDQITGGAAADMLDGGDGVDRLWSGPGNDLVRGGTGDDFLFGREGNDVLLGGDGDDYLEGGEGFDLLIGGTGTDHLWGGLGEDWLIGGSTSFDDDDPALRQLLARCAAPLPFEARVKNLTASDPSLYLRSGETVHDDGASDVLVGGEDADALFAALGDRVYTSGAEDQVFSDPAF